MTEERLRKAEIIGLEVAAANPDEDLARLEPRQSAALVDFYLWVADHNPDVANSHDNLMYVAGLAYGFGLGHDYALRYGRLGEEAKPSIQEVMDYGSGDPWEAAGEEKP